MAFSPTPEASMPTPDEVLAQVTREQGEPAQGYITPDDIAFAWQVFLSRLAHHDSDIAALKAARDALISRVTTLEQASGGSAAPPFAKVVPSEQLLPATSTAGELLLALDTGQWFKSNGSTWDRLGLDVPATANNLQSAIDRTDWIDGILDAIVGDQSVEKYTSASTYQPGDVVTHQGSLWLAQSSSTGVAPSSQTPQWSVLSLPDLLSKVKQALSQGAASGAMPVPNDPADDGKVLTARHGAGVWEALAAVTTSQVVGNVAPWSPASTYPTDSVVSHNGQFWWARSDTVAGEEPGVDGKWRSLLLPDILKRATTWTAPRPGPGDDGKTLIAHGEDATWVALSGVPQPVELPLVDDGGTTKVDLANLANGEYQQGEYYVTVTDPSGLAGGVDGTAPVPAIHEPSGYTADIQSGLSQGPLAWCWLTSHIGTPFVLKAAFLGGGTSLYALDVPASHVLSGTLQPAYLTIGFTGNIGGLGQFHLKSGQHIDDCQHVLLSPAKVLTMGDSQDQATLHNGIANAPEVLKMVDHDGTTPLTIHALRQHPAVVTSASSFTGGNMLSVRRHGDTLVVERYARTTDLAVMSTGVVGSLQRAVEQSDSALTKRLQGDLDFIGTWNVTKASQYDPKTITPVQQAGRVWFMDDQGADIATPSASESVKKIAAYSFDADGVNFLPTMMAMRTGDLISVGLENSKAVHDIRYRITNVNRPFSYKEGLFTFDVEAVDKVNIGSSGVASFTADLAFTPQSSGSGGGHLIGSVPTGSAGIAAAFPNAVAGDVVVAADSGQHFMLVDGQRTPGTWDLTYHGSSDITGGTAGTVTDGQAFTGNWMVFAAKDKQGADESAFLSSIKVGDTIYYHAPSSGREYGGVVQEVRTDLAAGPFAFKVDSSHAAGGGVGTGVEAGLVKAGAAWVPLGSHATPGGAADTPPPHRIYMNLGSGVTPAGGVTGATVQPALEATPDPYASDSWDVTDGSPFYIQFGSQSGESTFKDFSGWIGVSDPWKIRVEDPGGSPLGTFPVETSDGTALTVDQAAKIGTSYAGESQDVADWGVWPGFTTVKAHVANAKIVLDNIDAAAMADPSSAVDWQTDPVPTGPYSLVTPLSDQMRTMIHQHETRWGHAGRVYYVGNEADYLQAVQDAVLKGNFWLLDDQKASLVTGTGYLSPSQTPHQQAVDMTAVKFITPVPTAVVGSPTPSMTHANVGDVVVLQAEGSAGAYQWSYVVTGPAEQLTGHQPKQVIPVQLVSPDPAQPAPQRWGHGEGVAVFYYPIGSTQAGAGDLPRVLTFQPSGVAAPASARVAPVGAATWDVKDGKPFLLAPRQYEISSHWPDAINAWGQTLTSDDPMSVQINNPDGSTGETIPLQAADGSALSYKQVYQLSQFASGYGMYGGAVTWPYWSTFPAHFEGTGIRLDKVTSAVLADIPGKATDAYTYEMTPHPTGPYGAVAELWEKAGEGGFYKEHEALGGHVQGDTVTLGCKTAVEAVAVDARKIDGVAVDLALLKSDGTDLVKTCSVTGVPESLHMDQVAKILVQHNASSRSTPQVGDILTINIDLDLLNPRPIQRYIVQGVTGHGTGPTTYDLKPFGTPVRWTTVVGSSVRINWYPQAPAQSTPIVTLTDAEYKALSPKDPNTLYVVKG